MPIFFWLLFIAGAYRGGNPNDLVFASMDMIIWVPTPVPIDEFEKNLGKIAANEKKIEEI